MYIKKESVATSFNELEQILTSYSLPLWDELPEIELYMDQVISMLTKYLKIYHKPDEEDKIITPSMINNYVKLKFMPAPVKKKYSKVHLAYLLIIGTLKHTLDMATIQKIIPPDIDEDEVRLIFNSFVKNQKKAYAYVTDKVKNVAVPILENEGDSQERLNDLLIQVSTSANIFKIFTEKITSQSEE